MADYAEVVREYLCGVENEHRRNELFAALDALVAERDEENRKAWHWIRRAQEIDGQLKAAEAREAQLREALKYARDAISSPTMPFKVGQDIYDTPMMMGALRRADAALAAPSAEAHP